MSKEVLNINKKDWIHLIIFISVVLLIIVLFSEIYSFFGLAGEKNSLTWTGISSGIVSLTLAAYFYYSEKKESKKLAETIDELKSSIDELKILQQSNIEKQNLQIEKINKIEKELIILQKQPVRTSLLSFYINKKN